MLRFKIEVIEELKTKGFNTTRIRREKLIGEKTMQDMKGGILPGIKVLETLCRLLDCQPGDILEYVKDEENEK
ncbi:helix-turn-helix transcriptional regulator [Anaerotignum propionicum]|uniref:helix-turn-helix domain-containing protein n=1 Tax=Anaerotignum propionicum TaxID=28446 RepID=UPI002B2161D7|nr:helix-turn-helix transcriptional regulator [Anaerotignum propionicum]